MKYNIKKLQNEFANSGKTPKEDMPKYTPDAISNSSLTAYTDNDYLSLMRELNQLYDVVDSLTLTEKFLLGD